MAIAEDNTPAPHSPDEMRELFRICRLIHEEYSGPMAPRLPSDYDEKRRALDYEFTVLCEHLIAMAFGQLASRSAAAPHGDIVRERRSLAKLAISLLFNPDGKKPQFAIVSALQRLFGNNAEADERDLIKLLSGAVAISLRNISKTQILEGGSLFAFTSRHVNDFLANSTRYRRTGRWIAIDSDRRGSDGSRIIMCRDLVSLGSAPGKAFRTPEGIAADILDAVRELATQRAWLSVSELRQAVYEIYGSQVERAPLSTVQPNPEEQHSQNELCGIARSTVHATSTEYRWKAGHSAETRTAFEKAAGDKLEDSILLSEKGDSNFGYLARHIKDMTADEFERAHKGSFQHFWLVVHKNWKKYHAKA